MSQADWLEKDFYKVLGVDKTASTEEIRKAYKKLARENHPDANPGDPKAEERFKTISEANDVLSDAKTRQEYDHIRQLSASGGLGGFGGRGGFPGGFSGGGTGASFDLNDLLGNIFGDQTAGFGGGRAARPRPCARARTATPR